ncbi:MAG: ferritin family protein [Planctomycetota bacterium]|jgi:rubrerythrin
MQKSSVDEILDFAIAAEKAANRFYLDLAAKMENEATKKAFEEFAEQEDNHRVLLEGVKHGKAIEPVEVADMKISDYVVDVEPHTDMDYQEAITLAMKREKAAFAMYTRLAESAHTEEIRQTFQMLAQEEARHKLYFETEYDRVILKEN